MNDYEIRDGIRGFRQTLSDISHVPISGPFRCVMPVYDPLLHCCTSSSYDEISPSICVWDRASLESYALLNSLMTANIVPRRCQELDANFTSLQYCASNDDCGGDVCMGPYLKGESRILHFSVSPSWARDSIRNITSVGHPNAVLSSRSHAF